MEKKISVVGIMTSRRGATIFLSKQELDFCIFFLKRQSRPVGAIVDLIRKLEHKVTEISAIEQA